MTIASNLRLCPTTTSAARHRSSKTSRAVPCSIPNPARSRFEIPWTRSAAGSISMAPTTASPSPALTLTLTLTPSLPSCLRRRTRKHPWLRTLQCTVSTRTNPSWTRSGWPGSVWGSRNRTIPVVSVSNTSAVRLLLLLLSLMLLLSLLIPTLADNDEQNIRLVDRARCCFGNTTGGPSEKARTTVVVPNAECNRRCAASIPAVVDKRADAMIPFMAKRQCRER
mmetsp:Transcript_24666/g.54072  ORF Transcript_24666/g.54072 Transcript_24666/m.54072 type:complete len:224 (+) Transcript_24666:3312-3983(+)